MLARRPFLLGAAALPLASPAAARAASAGLVPLVDRAASLDQLHALVVRQGDRDLVAEAFRGPGLDRVANVKSVSKTLLALLTGIAVARGTIPGPQARVLPLLGRPPAGDARDEITVGHLLSMRGGLASTSGARYGAWVASRDWVDHVLEGPMQDRPGGAYIYSTGGWHVLGAILSRATGESLLSLARSWLGRPLGIGFAPWDRDPQGRYMGGNQMALTPTHLARVGDMVRSDGAWGGRQVVPAAWIDRSWRSRGRTPWTGDGYGYGWFLTRMAGRGAAYGRGYGGQVLAVVPALDLTMAITSDPDRPARTRGHFGDLAELMRGLAQAVADGGT
jgi:CubicO group peptidase (beta-lactamase class C family)